ncbi:hypothetical protein [Oryzicola mucosus]|nr:hypothetical protein [Oryzicola mucosus]
MKNATVIDVRRFTDKAESDSAKTSCPKISPILPEDSADKVESKK